MKEIKISKSDLKRYYWKKNFSSRRIAEIYNCNKKTVLNKMKKWGIKLRHQNKKSLASRFIIEESDLEKLYNTKKFSIYKIAQIYNCCSWTVWKRMKECGIKAWSREIYIPKNKIKNLYAKQKLTATEIAKIYQCSRPTVVKLLKKQGIKLRTHSEDVIIYERKEFSNNPLEKAYLIGFRLGDLHVLKNGQTLIVKCSTTRREQVELFKKLFNKYGHVGENQGLYKGRFVTYLYCLLNDSFNFLLEKKDNIEDWIMKNDYNFLSFLAGYIDAEGNIHTGKRRKSDTSIKIESYDKGILNKIWLKLNSMNIKCFQPKFKIRERHRKPLWCFRISSHALVITLLKKIIPLLKHKKRLKDAENALKNTILYAKFYKVK